MITQIEMVRVQHFMWDESLEYYLEINAEFPYEWQQMTIIAFGAAVQKQVPRSKTEEVAEARGQTENLRSTNRTSPSPEVYVWVV